MAIVSLLKDAMIGRFMISPGIVSSMHAIQIIPEDYELYQLITESPEDRDLFIACHGQGWKAVYYTPGCNPLCIHAKRCGQISEKRGTTVIEITTDKLARMPGFGASKICACNKCGILKQLQAAWGEYNKMKKLYHLETTLDKLGRV